MTPFTSRPQLPIRQRATRDIVAAQPLSRLAGLPQGNTEIQGLLRGLSMFSPALESLSRSQDAADLNEATKIRKDTQTTAGAVSQQVPNPREALTGAAPVPLPASVPPAYSDVFQASVREGLAQRTAIANKADAITEYNDLKDTEGFDAKSWLVQQRQKALKGITDPSSIDIIGRHFGELEGAINAEDERNRIIKREEVINSTLLTDASDRFTGNLSGEQLADAYQPFLDKARSLGKTGKEASQYLLMQLQHVSNQMGGSPELFDAFDAKDKDGTQIGLHLRAQIDQARQQAVAARDKRILTGAEQSNGKVLDGILKDIDVAPELVTEERLLGEFTQYGAVQSPQQYAALLNAARDSLNKKTAMGALSNYQGPLWDLKEDVQKNILTSKAQPAIDAIKQGISTGDSAGVAQAAAALVNLQTGLKSTVGIPQLMGMFKSLPRTAPEGGPDAHFTASVEVYKAMAKAPNLRDLYFDEDTSKVLEGYAAEVENGSDPKAALAQAYASVSPEAKQAALEFSKTPEFSKLVNDDAKKYVTGNDNWWPKWLGGNKTENQDVVRAGLSTALRNQRALNPNATADQMEAWAESWTRKNYVLDTNTGAAIKVPQGLGGEAAQEAITEYSKRVAEQLNLGSRNDGEWSVQFIPLGSQGEFNVLASNGSAKHPIAKVSLSDLMRITQARKTFTLEERQLIGTAKADIAAGRQPMLSRELFAKAEALGTAFSRDELNDIKTRETKRLMSTLESVPKLSFGTPSADRLQHIPARAGQVDHKLTARAAQDFLGGPSRLNEQSLAASLITVGEGMVLQAYDDPARGAGKNIGMGYNLKANGAKAASDLKQAGVPEERIQDVIEGRASLNPEQAKRLTLVALPRYEKQVREVAEAASPGLWERMIPAQKAVMIDVAWQTGNPVQFKKAWASLVSGDAAAFTEETKVYYTDRAGNRKEDTRRNALRASLLSSVGHWVSTVREYGSLPTTKLQASMQGSVVSAR